MDGHVGRLHCRYRSMTNSPADAQFAVRLNRVAKERLPEALADALDRALGEDTGVYVLRSIKCDLFFNADANADEAQLARAWGERIAATLVRTIHLAGSGSRVVRFADRADQIASFIIDLLRGQAWTSWFHHAFDHLRSRDAKTALYVVLTESGSDLGAVLISLHRRGVFEKVCASLDPDQLYMVWQQLSDRDAGSIERDPYALRASVRSRGAFEGALASVEADRARVPGEQSTDRAAAPPESLRPLFITALRLVDLLDLWTDDRGDTERLFRLWHASGPGHRTGLTGRA
jgi:hypothetical protein